MEMLGLGALSNIVQISGLAAQGRANDVEQQFQKNLAEVDYRIQRQQLHREDVRDLVELTVGRMDLYHVVGTLLLTFCISWYTGNGIIAAGLPKWFATLFLINNFCAVGYLIFSVWLAMHASIVAHSIGVRLLTSFARLSIPGREELDALRTCFYGVDIVDRFQAVANFFLDSAGSTKGVRPRAESGYGSASFRLSDARACSSGQTQEASREMSRSRLMSTGSQGSAGRRDVGGAESGKQHFRRFLREQQRWLSYDAYARVCMALGLNQMLQALAYYTQGVLWRSSPTAASTSFCAIQFLGLLLMSLDVGFGSSKWRDAAALLCFYVSPPLIASGLLWTYVASPELVHSGRLSLAATSCFLLHAGWLVYILAELRPRNSNPGELPPRFRAVYYLNVVELQQRKIAAAVRADTVHGCVERVRTARIELQCSIEELMCEEANQDSLSAEVRQDDALTRLSYRLERRLRELRSSSVGIGAEAQDEIQMAERALHHFSVWVKAPDILEKLEALRSAAEKGWLSDEEKRTIEGSYQAFLRQCRELNVGVLQLRHGSTVVPTEERLRVVVLAARCLRDTGTGILGDMSDPYVVVRCGSQLQKTPRIKNSLSPAWTSGNDFFFELQHRDTTVELEVFNKNLLKDDSLGTCSVNVRELPPGVPVRCWRSLQGGDGAELQLELNLELPAGQDANATPIHVQAEDEMVVRLQRYYEDLGLPQTVWVATTSDKVMHSGPSRIARVTSFEGAMRETGEWASAADALLSTPSSGEGGGQTPVPSASVPPRKVSFAPGSGGMAREASEDEPSEDADGQASTSEGRAMALLPSSAAPPEALPGQLFRLLTAGIVVWWIFAACFHAGGVLVDTQLLHGPLTNWTFPEAVKHGATELTPEDPAARRGAADGWWPEPAAFFQVASLQCTSSRLWITGRFSPSIYSAERLPRQRLGPLAELRSESGGSASSSWLLPWDGRRLVGAASVTLPGSWRLVAASLPHRHGGSEARALREARLAGWDGESVILATMRWDVEAANWWLQPRSEVEPLGVANCSTWEGSVCVGPRPSSYDDVLAIQLADEGRVLVVLLPGGVIDGWDVETGKILGRWSYGQQYSAMCYDGSNLVMARQGEVSPVLESHSPPWRSFTLQPNGALWELSRSSLRRHGVQGLLQPSAA